MAKTKDKVYDAAGNVKPYVDRALSDEKLREDVLSAFNTAKDLYNELVGSRSAVTLATRVATDDDVRDRMREAIEDLRDAAGRIQGKKDHSGRNTALLMTGIVVGLLFNPVTGSETRKWLKDLAGGGSDSSADHHPPASSNGA
jgi:gas vesicle protein